MTEIRARVPVSLADRSYEILIGDRLLETAGALMLPVLGKQRRAVIVTDASVVAAGHLARLQSGLAAAGIGAPVITLPSGEATKSWTRLAELCDELLALGTDRNTCLIALGGGVIGDLTGFAASIVMRGVEFIQIPTTLLSQVDSSVGGKTGINTAKGKNMVGSFHQPRLVLADLDCLATLPARELRAGYAEVVKYGVLGDLPFFAWLETHGAAVLAGDRAAQAYAVEQSCRAKAAIVAEDEREGGRRALLNLGHTFGHALEAETGFGTALLHGEAVSIGMVQAMDLSVRLGLTPKEDADRLVRHLQAVGMPWRSADVPGAPFDPERLLAHMAHDKKASHGSLTFVVCTGLGRSEVRRGVDPAVVRPSLAL
jgi:3-dehydroquinate synthase